MGMTQPPSGHDDLDSELDARWLYVPVAGLDLWARKPIAESLPVLNKALSQHSPAEMRNDMVAKFLHDNLEPDSLDRMWEAMVDPGVETPGDLLEQVMRAVATLGTARPTVPSRS